jgi:hypothetical protein
MAKITKDEITGGGGGGIETAPVVGGDEYLVTDYGVLVGSDYAKPGDIVPAGKIAPDRIAYYTSKCLISLVKKPIRNVVTKG